jgi:Protein of unknown function (DUF3020)
MILIFPDKDNDLRCRVNKKATLLFGIQPSPKRSAYIDQEFKKRKQKRKGKQSSPEDIGSEDAMQAGDMYSNLLNNPEFTNVLMGLLAQKGVEVGGEETTKQLVELLKSHPEFLKGFLGGGTDGTGEQMRDEEVVVGEEGEGREMGLLGEHVEREMQLAGEGVEGGVIDAEFHEMQGDHRGLLTAATAVNFTDLPADQHQSTFTGEQTDTHAPTTEPLSTTSPIPQLPISVESTPMSALTVPIASVPSYPPMPIRPPFRPSAILYSPPPPERIQAFGFPRRVG